eukprot:sb/3467857/
MSNLIILYEYHEAPPFLHGNPNIKAGYRGYLTPKLCLRSLFMLHNETINIWSHLLVGLYFFYQYFYDARLVGSYEGTNGFDHSAFVTMIIAIQICMFSSTAYHLFNCQSHAICQRMLLVDCIGIAIGLSGCFFPVMYYAFYCFPELKVLYGVGIGIIFAIAGYIITRPWFGDKQYTYIRIVTYSLVALSGVLPSGHWTLLHGIHNPIVSQFLPRIALLYALAGLGAFFYVTQIPESLCPGRFDILGHSHQLWHACAAAVFLVGHHTQETLFLYIMNHPCPS